MSMLKQFASGLVEAGSNFFAAVLYSTIWLSTKTWGYILYPIGSSVVSATATLLSIVLSGLSQLMSLSWNYLVLPFSATGINILGYVLEKALFGPPGLRPFANEGIFPANVDYGQRNKLILEYGFDPYENLHPVIDNFFGAIFGAGFGLFQYLNYSYLAVKNFLLSVYANLRVTFNVLLGKRGVMGERLSFEDSRDALITKVLFGILCAPVVAALALITNALDLTLTTMLHALLSLMLNTARTFNLVLGDVGTFGRRRTFEDKRSDVVLRWGFGLITAPGVIAISTVTNLLDISLQTIKHFSISAYYNIQATYNLLGERGVLGKRTAFNDDRNSLVVKLFFGVLSSPVVVPVIIITNSFDGAARFTLETARSSYHNLKATSNLLGTNGQFGQRQSYSDNRSRSTRVLYGIVSFPLVLGIATLSNTIDAVASVTINLGKSIRHQLQRHYNLLGHHGVFGAHQKKEDARIPAAQWIYGTLALPITVPILVIPNSVDFVATFFMHIGLSYTYNMQYLISLARERKHLKNAEKQEAEAVTFNDTRHPAVVGVFAVLSAPLVIPSATISYLSLGGLRVISNTALSVKYNFLASYNLLGNQGVFGPRPKYNDPRQSILKRIVFGIISSPIVIVASTASNTANLVLSTGKHLGLSVKHNVRTFYNALGARGILGPHAGYNDRRHIILRLVFGAISLPIVVPTLILTNSFDLISTLGYHTALSVIKNLEATYHLLGEHGVMGKQEPYNDKNRHIATRIIFGVISSPLVILAATITNTIDATLASIKNTLISVAINMIRTYNIVLGHHGVFGNRMSHPDPRNNKFAEIVFGILSAPLVLVCAALTNTVDLIATSSYHIAVSYYFNLKRSFNLLGNYGVMGPRHAYDDSRHIATRILFGILSAPLVGISALLTNTLDGSLTLLNLTKNVLIASKTWKILGGIVGVTAATLIALPAFMARRFTKSGYYLLFKSWSDPDYNTRKVTKSATNLITFGSSALAFKYFGYSSRFREDYMNQGDESVIKSKATMKDMILAAKRGELKINDENVDKQSDGRKLLRFLGLEHNAESILRQLDDEYRIYLQNMTKEQEQHPQPFAKDNEPSKNPLGDFFISNQGQKAVQAAKLNLGQGVGQGQLVDNLVAEIAHRSSVPVGG